MRLTTLAVTLLASLLSLSANATSIPASNDWQPSIAAPIAVDRDFTPVGGIDFVATAGLQPVALAAADAVVAEAQGGYRFSRFVAFHSITRYCLDSGTNLASNCYPTDNPRSVPEPGTMLLLGTGLLLLALGRRRRGQLHYA